MKTIVLIHAVEIAIDPIKDAFAQLWPEANLVHLWDQSLSIQRAQCQEISNELYHRLAILFELAKNADADAVMFTCSAFGPAIERIAERSTIPVLKPNQAMFDQALSLNKPIAMIGSFLPAMAGMEQEFYSAAKALGKQVELESICIPKARVALENNDPQTHNQLNLEAAQQLADKPAIMLAHFSSSCAKDTLEKATGETVLSSPHCAVSYLKNLLNSQ